MRKSYIILVEPEQGIPLSIDWGGGDIKKDRKEICSALEWIYLAYGRTLLNVVWNLRLE
jgi:hypothetical protein